MTRNPRSDDEQRLTERLQSGDPDALEEIFKAYGPAIMQRLKQRFGPLLNPADLEDAMAVAMSQVWFHRDRFDPAKAGLSTWLYVIARNAVVDAHRRRPAGVPAHAPVDPAAPFAASRPASAPNPLPGLEAALDRAISALSPREQTVIRAYAQAPHGAQWADAIARELGLTAGHVRVLRLRAVEKLRRALVRWVGEHDESTNQD